MNKLKFRILSKKDNTIRSCNTKEDFELMYDILYNDNEDYTILQSTGLVDADGEEIFEGDIVNCDGRCVVITFDKDYSSFMGKQLGSGRFEFSVKKPSEVLEYKVIGNIYKRKEI